MVELNPPIPGVIGPHLKSREDLRKLIAACGILHWEYQEYYSPKEIIIKWNKPKWWQWGKKSKIKEAEFYILHFLPYGVKITFKYK